MVNTFLPYPSFTLSAAVLDYRRLMKQRVEAMQLVNTILSIQEGEKAPRGYANHPATLMWINNLEALKLYHNIVIDEWVERGYKNNMKKYEIDEKKLKMPWWLGFAPFHYAQQASLVRKDPKFYKNKFRDLPHKYRFWGYVWPTPNHLEKDIIREIKKVDIKNEKEEDEKSQKRLLMRMEHRCRHIAIEDVCYAISKAKGDKNADLEYVITRRMRILGSDEYVVRRWTFRCYP